MFGKSSFLDLESNSEVFVDVWLFLDKSIREFSVVYKKMCALMGLKVYNHDLGLQLVQLYKVCFEYSGYPSLFLFHAHVL